MNILRHLLHRLTFQIDTGCWRCELRLSRALAEAARERRRKALAAMMERR